MDDSFYLVASAMNTAAIEQQRIANNLANLQTPGFKEVFSLVENLEQANLPKLRTTGSWQQGQLSNTGSFRDLAVEGSALLALEGNGQQYYFRSGTLALDSEGFLNVNGHRVLGEDGTIAVPLGQEHSLKIDAKGSVSVNGEVIATLKIVEVEKPQELLREGGLYVSTSDQERPAQDYQIRQGFLENSTVDSAQAVTEMISNLRYFEAMQKITGVMDQSLQNLIQSSGT